MSAATANLPALPSSLTPEGNLSRYLADIRKFPLLEPQEEFMLAKRWREHGDTKAAHRLVTSHLRLVAKIAMGYRGYGLPIAELISEGNVGLMQAVKRFEPDKRLPPRHLCHVVDPRLDPGIHPAFVVAREDGHHRGAEEAVLQPAQGQEPDLRAMEEGDLDARTGEADRDQARRHRAGRGGHEPPPRPAIPRSTPPSARTARAASGRTGWWTMRLDQEPGSPRARSWTTAARACWPRALSVLNDRERRIFEARRLVDEPMTLEDLSAEFGVSRERVRQIEVRAFEKVQKAVKNMVVEAAARPTTQPARG
jgi:RNA polymerase sigma-32 factor